MADGNSACIADPPAIRTVAGEPVRLNVSAPSQVRPGDEVEVSVAALDGLGNWSRIPPRILVLKMTRDGRDAGGEKLETSGTEETISFRCTPAEDGIYFFAVDGPMGLAGRSNVMLCQKGDLHLKLYFGDIHGHSRVSDGTGTPEDYYRFA